MATWMMVLRNLWAQWRCLLFGHDGEQINDPGEIYLRCRHCQGRSPGWALDGARPVRRFAGDPVRHQLRIPQVMVYVPTVANGHVLLQPMTLDQFTEHLIGLEDEQSAPHGRPLTDDELRQLSASDLGAMRIQGKRH